MKHYLFIATIFLAAYSLKANAPTTSTIIEQEVKEIIYVSVKITSDNGPVEGALIKIYLQETPFSRMDFFHSGPSDHNGIANFKILDYTNPTVNIEVSHPLYMNRKIKAITLKHGHIVNIHLKTKESTGDALLKENDEKNTDREKSIGNVIKNQQRHKTLKKKKKNRLRLGFCIFDFGMTIDSTYLINIKS